MSTTALNRLKSAADFDALADQLRSRVDLFGKSLAGLATVGTGAVGLKTVSDLAPRGEQDLWYALAAIGGLLLAAVCAIVVAGRLMQVNQPVVVEVSDTSEDAPPDSGFNDYKGYADLHRIFTSTAQRYGNSSLLSLSDRERELRRAASEASSDAERDRRLALAADIKADIEEAIARARWAIVRRRAAEASSGTFARWLFVGVAAGLLAFAFLSDVATANQDDNIKMAKACAEARKAGALGDDFAKTKCDKREAKDKQEPSAPPPTADEARITLLSKMIESLGSCSSQQKQSASDDDKSRPLAVEDCTALKTAIATLLERVGAS